MFDFFKKKTINYQNTSFDVSCSFTNLTQIYPSATQALTKIQQLEQELLKRGTINRTSTQRILASKVKGNTEAIIIKLDEILKELKGVSLNSKIKDKKNQNKDKLDIFYEIYKQIPETLNVNFNHVTTANLNKLKIAILEDIRLFIINILDDETASYHSQVKKKSKLTDCKKIFAAGKALIAAARNVSGVFVSLAIIGDLLAQLEVMDDMILTHSAADLFIDTIPKVINSQVPYFSLGPSLNTLGSAFQFEYIRNYLIEKLELYLGTRARLEFKQISYGHTQFDSKSFTLKEIVQLEPGEINSLPNNLPELTPFGAKNKVFISKKYIPINRGFFYNKTLQNERIKIAAKLLTTLETMRMENEGQICLPQHLADLLINTIEENRSAEQKHGRIIDGSGQLAKILKETVNKMGEIYTQRINFSAEGISMNLREKLSLPNPNGLL